MLAVWVIILTSLVPVPLNLFLNSQEWVREPVTIAIVGVVAISLILLVPYLFVRRLKNPDFILYVMSLFTFGCSCDLIMALGADSLIPELFTFYHEEGEEYLWTAYGILSNYWDGVVHYSCCLWMLYCVNNGKSYRKVGLFWAGSMSNGVIVMLLGSIVGKFGLKHAIVLSLPYLVVPLWVGYKLLTSRPQQQQVVRSGIFSKLIDIVFVMYFLTATYMDFMKAGNVLGTKIELFTEYCWDHEPYLLDPVAYPKIQMLIYLMYFIPFYCCATYGLLVRCPAWLPDWALLYAGAAAQGQFTHIGSSVHYKTDPEFVVPDREHSRNVFWIMNILLFVGPLLFALWQNRRPSKVQRKLE